MILDHLKILIVNMLRFKPKNKFKKLRSIDMRNIYKINKRIKTSLLPPRYILKLLFKVIDKNKLQFLDIEKPGTRDKTLKYSN